MAAARDDGRAEFVLSTVHYIETAQRGYGPRRRQVAELMIEMTQHRTIRSALGKPKRTTL
jgi:outer membrane protein assembly factor BamE (lipoprotein component of BamABCDE complex)